ncbi:Hsp70 family protein [Dactylosporangium sp. CS-047395]|uniref:Hsp70 family protein n=1 Tax=Dactylosporangium sp. CS-047395 TaxID=3239936 RepID=UPI003D913EEF
MGGYHLGIDFGTARTSAVLVRPDGRRELLLLEPSAVCLDNAPHFVAGPAACAAGEASPDRFEPHPRRTIDKGSVVLGGVECPVRSLFAAVFTHIASVARKTIGGPVSSVAITHPAHWHRPQTQVLEKAAALVGLRPLRLVPEPAAAALHADEQGVLALPDGTAAVVLDLGAGSVDASVVQRTGRSVSVLSSASIPEAGGLALDAAILTHLGSTFARRKVWRWNPDRTLLDGARAGREELTTAKSTTIPVPWSASGMSLTRTEFENLARPALERAVHTVASLVAGVAVPELQGVLLTGGLARTPLVTELLIDILGVLPVLLDGPTLAEGALLAEPSPVPRRPRPPVAERPVSAAPTSPAGPRVDPNELWAALQQQPSASAAGARVDANELWAALQQQPSTSASASAAGARVDANELLAARQQRSSAATSAAGARVDANELRAALQQQSPDAARSVSPAQFRTVDPAAAGPTWAASASAGAQAAASWAAEAAQGTSSTDTGDHTTSAASAASVADGSRAGSAIAEDPWAALRRESAGEARPSAPWRTGSAAASAPASGAAGSGAAGSGAAGSGAAGSASIGTRRSGRVLYDARAAAAPAPVAPPPVAAPPVAAPPVAAPPVAPGPAVATVQPAPVRPKQLEPWEIRAELWALEQDKPWRFEKELKAIRSECRAAEIESRALRADLVSIANEVMRLRSEMDLAETDLDAAGAGLRSAGAEMEVFEAELDLVATRFRALHAYEQPEPAVEPAVSIPSDPEPEPVAAAVSEPEPESITAVVEPEPESEPEPIAVVVEPEFESEPEPVAEVAEVVEAESEAEVEAEDIEFEPEPVEVEVEVDVQPELVDVHFGDGREGEAAQAEQEEQDFVPWVPVSGSAAVEDSDLLATLRAISDPQAESDVDVDIEAFLAQLRAKGHEEPPVEEAEPAAAAVSEDSRAGTATRVEAEPDAEDFGALVRVVRRYMQSARKGTLADPLEDGANADSEAEPPLSDVAVSPAPRFPAPKLTLADRSRKEARARDARWWRERSRPKAKPDPRPRAHRRRRLSPPVSAALTLFVALVALGSGTVVALKMTGSLPERQFEVGECVAQTADRATVVDCDARGAFEITKQIPKAERCPEVNQPFVIKDGAQFCLVPVTRR